MAIESRFPLVEDLDDLRKITVTLRGKLPASEHALCDLLDREAQAQATAQGLVLVACASEAVAGSEPAPAETPAPEKPAGKGKKKAPVAPVAASVPTLTRDYWAAPKA